MEGNRVIRIKFNKLGLMKYIGHLDTQRYFQRVIRRAGIDVAYSLGFSPHQIMSFAQPLSVGVESRGEYFDLEVKSYTSAKDMIRLMNENAAEGGEVTGMSLLPERHEKAMSLVSFAAYTVRFRPGHLPSFSISDSVRKFNDSPSVRIMKKTKRSEKETELKDLVRSLSVSEEGNEEVIRMTVSAASGENLKPSLLIRALKNLECPEDVTDAEFPGGTDLLIVREDLFDKDLKPLLSSGEEF